MIVFHIKHIHKTIEAGTGIYRELYECSLGSKSGLDAVAGLIPVCFFMIELVDGKDNRHIVLGGIAGKNLSPDLNTLGTVHEKDTCLANLERLDRSTDEIIGTGSIDDIEFGVIQFGIECRSKNRLLVGLLEFSIVGYCVLVFHCAAAVDDLAFIKHSFGECGLAGLGRAQQDYITDGFG